MTGQELNGQQIIDKFHVYVDDSSELTTQEELDLANKIYNAICNDRPWEFLKKPASGVITVTNGVATIPLPDDFRYFAINNETTDNTVAVENNAGSRVIYVGPQFTAYQIVNWSDRRGNRGASAYLDIPNNRIVLTSVPPLDQLTYEFDYIRIPPAITLTTFPLFPSAYHDMIYQGMAVDHMIIQLFDRAKSYAPENQLGYDKNMRDLRYYNSQLTNN